MAGMDKLTPLSIGKSIKPRCIAGVNFFLVENTLNNKSWMTKELFEE